MRLISMHLVSALSVLLVLGVPMDAGAARPAQKAKKTAKTAGSLSSKRASQTPDKGLAGDITRRKAEKAKDIPALRYDDYSLGVELQVASKRQEQIESLKKIIELGPSPTEAPELTFRLAELYWEESKYHFFESNRKDDDIFRARADNNKAALSRAQAEKKQSLGRVKHFQKLACCYVRTSYHVVIGECCLIGEYCHKTTSVL